MFKGIGDIEESFGERNHQHESIADRHHGCTHNFALREKRKAKEQAQFNHPGVQVKVEEIINDRKRKYLVATKTKFQENAAENRRKREEARTEVLDFVIPANAKLNRLQDERTRLFREV